MQATRVVGMGSVSHARDCGDLSVPANWSSATSIQHPGSSPSPSPTAPSMSETMSDPLEKYAPQKLGEYKVVAEIAQGTFGKVKST